MRKKTPRGKLFVVSAPSGCGKTTLCKRLLSDKLGLFKSVSMTTRLPRPGEKDGADYYFASERQFRELIAKGSFLEHEENFGYLYGTPKKHVEDLLKSGKPVLLNIDVKGAMTVKNLYPKESVLIFLLPPSLRALENRLKSRMADPSDTIKRRLKLAREEMSCKKRYDYRVMNDNLDNAHRRLKTIIAGELR